MRKNLIQTSLRLLVGFAWSMAVCFAQAPILSRAQREWVIRNTWPEWVHDRLPPFMEEFRGGLGIWQWAGLLGLLLASLLIGFVVRHLATASLRARYKIPGLEFSQSAKRGTRRAFATLIAAAIWSLALPCLALPATTEVFAFRVVQLVATIAVIWLLVSLWNALCDLLLHRAEGIDKRTERLLVPLTRKFVIAVIFIGGLLAVLWVVGVNVISIIAGLGIGGLALALAAKDSVENIFGSLTILFDMPFALGDWIRIDKVEGVVEEINLRSTRLRTFEDSMITLPNSNLIKASVENFGARRFRRQRLELRFSHESDPGSIEEFCDALRQHINQIDGIVPGKTVVELNDVTEQWIGVLVIGYLDAGAAVNELRMRSKLLAEALRLAKQRRLRFAAAPALEAIVNSKEPNATESPVP